jgi:hypothetical protein
MRLFLLFIFLFSLESVASSQRLVGFWNGKISRNSGKGYGADNFEMHIYQSGKDLYGYTFAYKDTSQFVLYRFSGKLNKKTKLVNAEEFGYAYVLLPDHLIPCEKKFELHYTKINETKYLTGKWSGVSIDTTCYASEELLVALQKIDKPVFSNDIFIMKKIGSFLRNKQKYISPTAEITDSLETEIVKVDSTQLLPKNRKLDIQQIIGIKDSVIKVSLYDNAQIDGDTVSVFINKKPILVKRLITDKALSFNIPFPNKGEAIELLLQAENLGEIPPNTGVLIVEADGKRYEVRLQSDFEKHAVVVFTYVE